MARLIGFRFKSHHYAQLLSGVLFLVIFNFQSCARVKLTPTTGSKVAATNTRIHSQ